MQDATDMDLLRKYADGNSEEAFAALVTRHVNMVYSAALRKTGNPAAAEEITQAVFVILAKKADQLSRHAALSGWLYQVARLTAANFLRTEIRRARREQEAYMQSRETESEIWPQIMPLLEDAMGRLGEKDRNAIALRFFEGKSFQEIGAAFGASENAAKKRVAYALEKLRKYFSKHGVSSTTAIIAGTITANSVQAAPVTLAKSVAAVAITKGAAASGSILTLVKGTLKAITWAKYKFAASIATGLLLAGSAVIVAITEKNDDSKQPDPVVLLKNVAVAREKIKSGEIELLVAGHNYRKLWNIQTNYALLKVVFDGEKRRFEQLQEEIGGATEDKIKIIETKRIELNGDGEALARLGLIRFEDAHYRTIYDGKSLTQFEPRLDTTIDDPAKGSVEFLFDPRTFGLSDSLSPGNTIENCLAYQKAQSVSLIGKEDVEGISAWHVKVQVSEGWQYDFWIDATHSTHVIKQKAPNRAGMLTARFDKQHPEDPIPVEVDIVLNYADDLHPWDTRLIRRQTRYNVPIIPKAFTLAGLGMSVGTPVTDVRIERRTGYWTGSKLSDDFPRNTPPRQDSAVGTTKNEFELPMSEKSLISMKTDGSFVDERKIVLRRAEMTAGLLMLIFIGWMAIRYFQKKRGS